MIYTSSYINSDYSVECMTFTPDVSVCQVESNLPGEDRYVCRVTEDILTYGIYDGHGGYLAADIACATLQNMIIADIQSVAVEARTNIRIAEIIDAAFITCDDNIIAQALRLHRLSKEFSIKSKSINGVESNKVGPFVAKNREVAVSNVGKIAKFMGRAGSCAVVVVITGGMLFVAHVGYGIYFVCLETTCLLIVYRYLLCFKYDNTLISFYTH